MPTFGYFEDTAAWARRNHKARAEVRALLLAKGLTEGAGKWSTVFARHMRKRGL